MSVIAFCRLHPPGPPRATGADPPKGAARERPVRRGRRTDAAGRRELPGGRGEGAAEGDAPATGRLYFYPSVREFKKKKKSK